MSNDIQSTMQTGRKRYRILNRMFRKSVLVLQLEWQVKGSQTNIYGDFGPMFDCLVWRDAAVEDLTELNT